MATFTVHEVLIFEIAREITARIKESVIDELKQLSAMMLSGDDTVLRNTWEEYCVDLQQGTFYSEVYRETVEAHIKSILDKCTTIERALLFLDTEDAYNTVEEIENEGLDSVSPVSNRIPFDEDGVINMIRSEIEAHALNYTNDRIRRALEDDYEDDDEEQEGNDESEDQ